MGGNGKTVYLVQALLSLRAAMQAISTRNMEISRQEMNTYKPYILYINIYIDLYLYVKNPHYVILKRSLYL